MVGCFAFFDISEYSVILFCAYTELSILLVRKNKVSFLFFYDTVTDTADIMDISKPLSHV